MDIPSQKIYDDVLDIIQHNEKHIIQNKLYCKRWNIVQNDDKYKDVNKQSTHRRKSSLKIHELKLKQPSGNTWNFTEKR